MFDLNYFDKVRKYVSIKEASTTKYCILYTNKNIKQIKEKLEFKSSQFDDDFSEYISKVYNLKAIYCYTNEIYRI